MKKTAIILFSALSIFTAVAQEKSNVIIGNGNITKDSRSVERFDKISAAGPFEVRLVSGKQGEVSVEADNNIVDLVTTEVKNNTLKIAPREGRLFKSSKGNKVIVRVQVESIAELALTGSGSINSKTPLKGNVRILLEGTGKIDVDIASGNAEAVLSGSGDIVLNGKADSFKCTITGSGEVKAEKLQSQVVDVTITGSGDAKVFTNSSITGRITGSGNVAFAGNPKERDFKRTGSGEFKNL